MNIKPIIVREYLESLTENQELDLLFPILLESLGFIILSKPKEYKGFPQYGKDIVAIGKDPDDQILKKFYFELKGGHDRHITENNFHKKDGVLVSLRESKFKEFTFSNLKHKKLPLKIVLVHNGEINANVKETFDGFINEEFPSNGKISFSRWDISILTKLFSENLFGAYLLTDIKSTKLFNKVLINLNASEEISNDFTELIDLLLFRSEKLSIDKKTLTRKWQLIFESLKLISLIIYTESKEYNNLEIAKKHLTHIVLRFWFWILKNKAEKSKNIIFYFDQVLFFYFKILNEYFERTFKITKMTDGLSSEKSGRYEEIGYTYRTFEYMFFLSLYIKIVNQYDKTIYNKSWVTLINSIITANNVSARPLLDIDSISIINNLNLFLEFDEIELAKKYLTEVCSYVIYRKTNYDVLPDANNSIENVIKFSQTNKKPIYYIDSTSPLLNVLIEYTAILDMNELYFSLKSMILDRNIDLGLFIPHLRKNSNSIHLIKEKDYDLEEQLFSKSVQDGYQSELNLNKINYEKFDLDGELNFDDFKTKIINRKKEFEYDYRTDKVGYSFLIDLAHFYFKTPYFPDKWRKYLKE